MGLVLVVELDFRIRIKLKTCETASFDLAGGREIVGLKWDGLRF
jgi:hypothetical protein